MILIAFASKEMCGPALDLSCIQSQASLLHQSSNALRTCSATFRTQDGGPASAASRYTEICRRGRAQLPVSDCTPFSPVSSPMTWENTMRPVICSSSLQLQCLAAFLRIFQVR